MKNELKPIKRYFRTYLKWYPDEWHWELADDDLSRERYMKFRARKSSSRYSRNEDIVPDFTMVEKDANRFRLDDVEVTDIFGIIWHGTKGVHRYADDADYEQHLYFNVPEGDEDYYSYDEDDDSPVAVSSEYTMNNPPPADTYITLDDCEGKWIDGKDIVDVEYKWIKENHLLKDSRIVVTYDGPIVYKDNTLGWEDIANKDYECVYGYEIIPFVLGLQRLGREDLLKKIIPEVDKHFKALETSDREEEREFWPKCSAEEYFNKMKDSSKED